MLGQSRCAWKVKRCCDGSRGVSFGFVRVTRELCLHRGEQGVKQEPRATPAGKREKTYIKFTNDK